MLPLEKNQGIAKKSEETFFKSRTLKLDEIRGKITKIDDLLGKEKSTKTQKYKDLIELKGILDNDLTTILKEDLPDNVVDQQREAEAARLEENIKIAEEKFKGDPKTDYEGFRKFQLDQIKKLFKNGVDAVITHGNDIRDPMTREAMYDANGVKIMLPSSDQDANTALMFLELANTGKKYNFANREVAGSDVTGIQSGSYGFVPKGESYQPTKEDWGKTFLHVDTSGRKGVSIRYDKETETTHIYIDHHVSKTLKENTSAGELTLDLLKNLNMLKPEPWMEEYAKFNTEYDNYSFDLSKEHLTQNFWKTPRGLMKSFEKAGLEKEFIQFFKDGRDPDVPFTDAELDSMVFNGRKLRDIAFAQKRNIENSRDRVREGEVEAVIEGIKKYTKELGIISFNSVGSKKLPDGSVKDDKYASEGGLVTKSVNIQTFITYWENTGGLFLTSTKDITPFFERIKGNFPGIKLIRGKLLVFASPNYIDKPEDLDEVIYRKSTGEKFIKSKTDPKVFAELKANPDKNIQRNYFVQKNLIKMSKEEVIKGLGLVEEDDYSGLDNDKMLDMEKELKKLLAKAKTEKDTDREEKVAKALVRIETAREKKYSREATPEEIQKVAEEMFALVHEAEEYSQGVDKEIREHQELQERYALLNSEEEFKVVEPEPVVTKTASKKKAPKAKPSLTTNPDASKGTTLALEKDADLQALNNLKIGEPLVYKDADGNFSYKKVNMITKAGKIRFDGETAWISADTIEEWIKEKHAAAASAGGKVEKEKQKITTVKLKPDGTKVYETSEIEMDLHIKAPSNIWKEVESDFQKSTPEKGFSNFKFDIDEKLQLHLPGKDPAVYLILDRKNGSYLLSIINAYQDENGLLHTRSAGEDLNSFKVHPAIMVATQGEVLSWLENKEGAITNKVLSTSAEEIYNSWDKADIETFKIYQSGIMMGEKKGAIEKLFAHNKKSNEVVPLEEGWKYAISGGRKDFEYFFGELFDIKDVTLTKGMNFSDFEVVPATMNPNGTLKEKGKITIKK